VKEGFLTPVNMNEIVSNFMKTIPPYTLAGFDIATHNSAKTTTPGSFF
jgi:hypothetical protein